MVQIVGEKEFVDELLEGIGIHSLVSESQEDEILSNFLKSMKYAITE